MNPFALVIFLVSAVALLTLPRRLAPLALLTGSLFVTLGQGIEILSVNLPIYRLLLIIGIVRIVIKNERLVGGFNLLDKIIVTWGLWLVFAGCFHDWNRYGPVYNAGIVFNVSLIYFLIRIWCTDIDEIQQIIAIIGLLLIPIALEMLMEKATGKNLFYMFGGVSEYSSVREGKIRAQGPFLHAILAGTVGAVCIPLFLGILRRYRLFALVGIVAATIMVFASASSGPVMSLFAGIGALVLWKFRQHMSKFQMAGVIIYLLLMLGMSRPPYYLMGEIDLSGGSTGWHRAHLIEMTINHISEWWLFGTDFTRHWMPLQGIAVDPNHTDVTNYYISFAIAGGLLGITGIIAMLWVAFRWVGQILITYQDQEDSNGFMIWCFGSSLFAHAVTSLSVAYFDQSVLFFWLTLAVISSTYSIVRSDNLQAEESKVELRENDVLNY